MMSRHQMNQASISSPAQKCCIIQTQTFFFAWFKPNQRDQSLYPSTCCQPPSIPPSPKFHLGDIFLPFPLSLMLSTSLSLLSLWIQCAVALRFTCLTNMDRGPKWFLKSSNGLWSACVVLGDNSLSVSLSLPLTLMCVCVCDCVCLSGCLSVYVYVCLCLCLYVCVHARLRLPHALPDSLAGRDGSARWSGSLEMR